MNLPTLRSQYLVALGSLLAALGVAAGAFGAHALKQSLSPDMLAVYETAVRYQIYHAFGLIVAGLVPHNAQSRAAGWCFAAGILLFSGSLYLLTLTGVRSFGMITPLGGLAFIAGWLLLAYSLIKKGH
ncbi:MAG: DUF423 domain-containing protein [Ignavibacteriae bacterium]|nr:DUF423 domain-containing protein [Ignavibacteriota bacterium]